MKFKLKKDMRKIKFLAMVMVSAMAMVSCGGGDKPAESGDATASTETSSTTEAAAPAEASKDGIGKFTSANFDGKDAFDAALAAKGKEIVDVKCTSCHNMTK